MMRQIAIAAVLSAGCLALTACGGSAHSPNNVATAYLHDLGQGDYSGACGLLTDDLRHRLRDCPTALRGLVDELPVGEQAELRDTSVRHLVYKGSDSATLHPADISYSKTVKDKTGKSKITRVRSIGANHVTNGHGLTLVKVGADWRIADGGV